MLKRIQTVAVKLRCMQVKCLIRATLKLNRSFTVKYECHASVDSKLYLLHHYIGHVSPTVAYNRLYSVYVGWLGSLRDYKCIYCLVHPCCLLLGVLVLLFLYMFLWSTKFDEMKMKRNWVGLTSSNNKSHWPWQKTSGSCHNGVDRKFGLGGFSYLSPCTVEK